MLEAVEFYFQGGASGGQLTFHQETARNQQEICCTNDRAVDYLVRVIADAHLRPYRDNSSSFPRRCVVFGFNDAKHTYADIATMLRKARALGQLSSPPAPFQKPLSELRPYATAQTVAYVDSSSSELHNLGRESRCVSNRLRPLNQRSFGVGSEKLGGQFRGVWSTNQRKRARLTVDIQRKWAAAIQRSWADL